MIVFVDGSVDPKTGTGCGAFLAVENLDAAPESCSDFIRTNVFLDTSSSALELETFLWALGELVADEAVTVYSDSQTIETLLSRRERLERDAYISRNGNELSNRSLYEAFYKLIDERRIDIVKIKGHAPKREKGRADHLFALVDRAARRALRDCRKSG